MFASRTQEKDGINNIPFAASGFCGMKKFIGAGCDIPMGFSMAGIGAPSALSCLLIPLNELTYRLPAKSSLKVIYLIISNNYSYCFISPWDHYVNQIFLTY